MKTLVRLLREDPSQVVRALIGHAEPMVVFAADLDEMRPPSINTAVEFRPLSEQDLRLLPMPESFRQDQLARMAHLGGSHAFGVFCDGRLAHTSWLYDRDLEGRTPPRYLDLRPDEAEISACVTLPEYRGRGVYGIAIRGICAVARGRGIRRIYMKTAPSNRPSQRGIEKAGLARCGTVVRVVLPLWPSGRGVLLRRFSRATRS